MRAAGLACTALEAISAAREATAEQFAQYAGSDLLCYFAEAPQALVERQEAHWGPVLDRAEQEIALAFVRAAGIRHQSQPETTLQRVRELALETDEFGLAGLAFGAALFGSAILALALQRGWLTGEQAHALSRVDEAYQEEKWGVDEEAAERTARLLVEAKMLERWFRALDQD
jgi:chaperone required for assembly of F1-ATPase